MAFELLPLKPEQHTLTFVPRLSLELPFFNLTVRRKDIPKVIKYQGRDNAGRPIRWEVYQDTSDEIGAPAVEAHEVWYLLVKPSIDSQRRADGSIPEINPLGGIRECLRKVGWTAGGFQARELIKALTQISFAGCVADLWVPTGDKDLEGKEKFLQIKGRFSRMSVYAIGEHHLTEEELAKVNSTLNWTMLFTFVLTLWKPNFSNFRIGAFSIINICFLYGPQGEDGMNSWPRRSSESLVTRARSAKYDIRGMYNTITR